MRTLNKTLLLAVSCLGAFAVSHANAAVDPSSPWDGLNLQGRVQAWAKTTVKSSTCATSDSDLCGVGYLQGVVIANPATGYAYASTAPMPQVASSPPAKTADYGVAPSAQTVVAGSLTRAQPALVYRWECVAGASAGFCMTFNAASSPADGTVTPAECYPVAANGVVSVQEDGFPAFYSTGFVLVFSTTGCFSKTVSATAFLSAQYK